MKSTKQSFYFFAAAAVAAMWSTTAAAQRPKPTNLILLPCCKCVGGEGNAVNVNSGSAAGSVPWNVSGPGVGNAIAQTIGININPYWTATLPQAQWIHPDTTDGSTLYPGGTYNYTVRIVVP